VALEPALAWLTVRSAPMGAVVTVDGGRAGGTPADLQVSVGVHRFHLESEGFAPLDTLLAVTDLTGSVHFTLRELPPGEILILGDEVARTILVDDKLVVGGVQNSGRRPYPPGLHTVEVVLQRSGETLRKEVRVEPGKTVRYDYTRDEVTVLKAGSGGDKP